MLSEVAYIDCICVLETPHNGALRHISFQLCLTMSAGSIYTMAIDKLYKSDRFACCCCFLSHLLSIYQHTTA